MVVLFANTTMPKEGREVKHNRGGSLEKSRGTNEAHCTVDNTSTGRPSLCFQWRKICVGSHGWADIILLLVVIRLMAHGDLLFLDSAPQLAIRVLAMSSAYNVGVVLEDTPYRMEQTVYRQDGGGQRRTIMPLQQNLGIGVSLLRRLGQPVDGLPHVLGDILTLPVQLAQQIFGVGVVASADIVSQGRASVTFPSFKSSLVRR